MRRIVMLIGTLALNLVVSACSPTLDWREVRPEGAGVQAMFPCKPELNRRPEQRMGLAQCKAGGMSFALSWAEVPEPAQVGPALEQMRAALAAKLGGTAAAAQPLQLKGMTPHPAALTQSFSGGSQQGKVAVFARGLRVYQLAMLGEKANDAAWQEFLGGLKLVD